MQKQNEDRKVEKDYIEHYLDSYRHMKKRLNNEAKQLEKLNAKMENILEDKLKLSRAQSAKYRKSEEDKFSSRQMLLQLHEVKESLSKQRLNKLEELAKKIKVQTSTLQKNYEANQKQREQLQEAKANAWDEEELDLKRELVIKRLVVAYKTKKFNEKNKVYTDDNNSFKNIQRILNGDDNMTNRAEPKD